MPARLNLFFDGPEQALALISATVVFALLAALGRVVAGPRAVGAATPLFGWSVAMAGMLAAAILFRAPLAPPGWLALALGAAALIALARCRSMPLDSLIPRAALIALPLLLLAAAHRASEWDEFSHWAGAIRYVVEKGVLPGAADPHHGLQFPAYPFAFPLLNALAAWAAGRFLEGTGPVFNFLLLLCYGAMAVRLARLGFAGERKDSPPAGWLAAAFAVAAASVFNPSFVQKIIFTSYAETATGVATAFAGVLAWKALNALADGRDDEARALAWQFGLAAALLVSIKQVNLVLLAVVLAGALAVALRDPAIALKRLLPLAPAALLPPLLLYALWRYHVARDVGGAGEFSLSPVSHWLVGKIPAILGRMALIASKKGAYFGPMLIVVILGLRALWRCRTPLDRLALIATAAFLGYNAFLLFTYVAAFGEYEGLRAASFWRYNMHVALLGAAFGAYLVGALWRRKLGERPPPRALLPILLALAVALPVALAPKFRFDQEQPKPHFRAVAAAIEPLVPRAARLTIFDPSGTGESGIMTFYQLRRADPGMSWIGAGTDLTAARIAALFAANPPDFVLVHSGTEVAATATGLSLEDRASYLLRREGGRWTVAGRWPYPAR